MMRWDLLACSLPENGTQSTAFGKAEVPDSNHQGAPVFKLWLLWLDDRRVALPTFVLQFYALDGDRGAVRIQIGKSLILGGPTAENFVGADELTGFVV